MNPEYGSLGKQFRTPEEEVVYLRAQIVEKERALGIAPGSPARTLERREEIAREKVAEYRNAPAEAVLDKSYQMKIDDIETNVVKLGVEHKSAIDELMRIVETKGIKNALALLEKLNNPHIEDDFHRMLVQILLETGDFAGIAREKELARAFKMRLYEVTLPPIDPNGEKREFADLVSGMEHFYAGMLSIENTKAGMFDVKNYFALELAVSNFSEALVFYSAVPLEHADLFEKQVLAVYPDAKLREHREDYNPFNESGVTMASVAEAGGNTAYPLKTYEAFTQDPLNVLLSSFSKIKRNGEGVAVQIVFRPAGKAFNVRYQGIMEQIKRGVKAKDALKGVGAQFATEFAQAAKGLVFGVKMRKEEDPAEEEAVKNIGEKISSPIVDTNIRIISSAETAVRAEAILNEIESAFNQFGKPQANSIKWKRDTKSGALMETVYRYTFRMFLDKESFPLSLKELATLFHFPVTTTTSSELKEARAGGAPAPTEMAQQGIILGKNIYHNKETLVRMDREDRVRHMYVIGQTGTGKSHILKTMIMQDIKNGDGVCFIDPHGNDVQDILSQIPPERADDVIYFDPSSTERPMGLNMLEYDHSKPEQKTFVVNEMMNIFNQLFDMKVGGGAMFEQYFKNAAFLVMEDTSEQATLLDITRVLSDKAFRDMKLSRCKNPIIAQFWASAEKTTGDQGLANFVPYISSKFDPFISNDIMRPVVLQKESSFNFREIMDNKKILLVNLSKGRLGDINANLIGLVLVGKITMAALSRVDMFGTGQKPNDFYLYIDEFHNVTTPSIASILSEARKYRLSLNVAHQYIAQIPENIRDAVFGNVGNMAVFRVGQEDAEFLEKNFAPTFSAQDITKLDNRNAYVNMLVNGQPTKPFNIVTLPLEEGNPAMAEKLKQLSALRYGIPQEEVNADIFARYRPQV
ncbi:MAG: type IV secretion system DNA-binding domain-containing protein [Candidatus Yonathbacteria bacterium]|nr:type IV secretion system DNA-binding domain-containing protein [Candidatus Yonathbacteria bacterium]